MKSYIYITLVVLFFQHHVLSYTVESMPNPSDRGSYIANPDGVLKASTVNELNSSTSLLEKETTVELAIAVVDSIGDEVPKTFATALFRKWGIGKKDKNNGLLILVVMDQRRFEIEVGYGLEGTVTDAKASQIIRHHMIPTIRKNGVDQAVIIGFRELSRIVRGEDSEASDDTIVNDTLKKEPNLISIMHYIIFVPFVMMFMLMGSIFFRVSKVSRKVRHDSESQAQSNITDSSDILNTKKNTPLIKSEELKDQKNISIKDFLKSILNIQKNTISSVFFLYIISIIFVLILTLSYSAVLGFFYFFYKVFSNGYLYIFIKEKNHLSKISSFIFGESSSFGFSKYQMIALPQVVVFIYIARQVLNLQRKYVEKRMKEEGFDFISDENEKEYLSEGEVLEEEIGSVEYDIFKNPMTGKIQKITRDIPFSGYVKCSSCSTKAGKLISDEVISHATYSSSGSGVKTYECLFCHEIEKVRYTIPKKTRSSSGRGSSSSSSGGSSFGGGSSGGGGAGGSW